MSGCHLYNIKAVVINERGLAIFANHFSISINDFNETKTYNSY